MTGREKMEIRNFPPEPVRVETGPVQFGDDWPGVFLRGDYCFGCCLTLRRILENDSLDAITKMQVRGILNTLAGAIIGPAADGLKVSGASL